MAALITSILLIIVLTLISSAHGLGFLLFLMMLHGAIVGWFGESAVHIPMYSGIAMLVLILAKQEWRGVKTWILGLFITLITLMAFSSLFAFNQDLAITYFSLYAKNFALALLIAGCIRNIQAMRIMTLYCIAGATAGGLLAIYQHLSGNLVVSTIYDQRAGGLSNDPNDAAMLMMAGPPLCMYWFYHSKPVLKAVFLGIAGLILIGIILTGSRGGFVALCLVALVVYVRRPSVMNTAIGVLILVCGIALAPSYYKDRIATLFTGKELNGASSLDQRGQLLRYGLQSFLRHPGLGTGTGNFGSGFTEIANESGGGLKHSNPSTVPYMPAHNLYLEFFVENGIFAGLTLLTIFGVSLRGLIRQQEVNRRGRYPIYSLGYLTASALIGMMVAGLFLSQGKNAVMWFLIGLGLSSYQLKSQGRLLPLNGRQNAERA